MSETLWKPQSIAHTQLTRFHKGLQSSSEVPDDYAGLQRWSTENLESFWEALVEFVDFQFETPATRILNRGERFQAARWFEGASLNFAKNILRHSGAEPAIIFYVEERRIVEWSFDRLYVEVSRLQQAMQRQGVVAGDRVCGLMPNMPETIAAMLAATSLGAVWSSCSPDFGEQGVLDRFGQIEPRVLFSVSHYIYKGKRVDCQQKLKNIINQLPSLERTVLVPFPDAVKVDGGSSDKQADVFVENEIVCAYKDFIRECDSEKEMVYTMTGFDQPVYIMYSSGTTGLPKCMVQGPGVLLNHIKEHVLHGDLRKGDRIFYYTTCGWMMWNWLVSALYTGATLILFEGNPFYPGPEVLWQMAANERINVFGTSPRYLASLEQADFKTDKLNLEELKVILSTGAPLPPESFEFVYKRIKKDLRLSSISGGTDLNGCFALGNPNLPVQSGELQCLGLGMAVEILNASGQPVIGEQGELSCREPFPSMPLYFWNDPDGEKYRKAYFDVYPERWLHGDFAELTPEGSLIVYGRSDATLNPGGVRIGTADIYRVVEAQEYVEDSVVIGQPYNNDVRVVLFIKLVEGESLDENRILSLRKLIRLELSPRHVPEIILPVAAIPYTRNMKKVEIAVRRAVMGQPITNKEALLNPESLQLYRNLSELN